MSTHNTIEDAEAKIVASSGKSGQGRSSRSLQVTINGQDVIVIQHDGQRVVTLGMIDSLHQRADGTARRTFNANKAHLIEGEDYFVRNSSEARELGFIAPNGLTLISETGYAMLTKSFTDEFAWKIHRELVKSYFQPGKSEISNPLARVQAQIESLTAEVRSLIVSHPVGVSVCDGKTAKEWLVEYGCKQKGRNPVVRKVSADLRDLALRHGIVIDKCARTGTWVFPSSLGRPYMESAGRVLVKQHNAGKPERQTGLDFYSGLKRPRKQAKTH